MHYDYAIVGAGIVGLATAAALARRGASLLVLEAEAGIARHQSGHNSGVVHAGLYYRPSSLRARLCRLGREAMLRFCAEHGIAHARCGKVVVAKEPGELPALAELQRRGTANRLAGLERLDAAGIRHREPHVRGVAGLFVPQTGIADFATVCRRLSDLVAEQDGELHLADPVERLIEHADRVEIETSSRRWTARFVIACAGLQADRVARRAGLDPDIAILPFRGEYWKLRQERGSQVRALVYPVPDPKLPFLGVHATRTVKGDVELGPNAVLAGSRHGYRRGDWNAADLAEIVLEPGFWRLAARHWRTGLKELLHSRSKRAFCREARGLFPELEPGDLQPGGAGVRAQAVGRDGRLLDDFHSIETERMIHVLNAPSPAATASLVLGEWLARRAERIREGRSRHSRSLGSG